MDRCNCQLRPDRERSELPAAIREEGRADSSLEVGGISGGESGENFKNRE